MLKGFGGKYFTLSAMQASSVNIDLLALKSRYTPLTHRGTRLDPQPKSKPCHCNILFKKLIHLILQLNIFIPRCPYYTTHYAFRRTGVHPPKPLL
ncbi:MAG: hypothetical protein WCR69_02170 [Sulfuricurvum sp.]